MQKKCQAGEFFSGGNNTVALLGYPLFALHHLLIRLGKAAPPQSLSL